MLKQGYFYHSKIGNSFNSLYCDLYFKSDHIEYIIRDYFIPFIVINKKVLSIIFKDYPNKIASFENFEISQDQEDINNLSKNDSNQTKNNDVNDSEIFVKLFVKDLRVYNDIKKRYFKFILYPNLSLNTIYFFLKEISLFNYYNVDIEKHPLDNVYELGKINKVENNFKPDLKYRFIDFIYENNNLQSIISGSLNKVDLYTIKKPLDFKVFSNYYFDKPEKEELKSDFNFYVLEDISSLILKFIELMNESNFDVLLIKDKNTLINLKNFIALNEKLLSLFNNSSILMELSNFIKESIFYDKLVFDFESLNNSNFFFHKFQDIPFIKVYSNNSFGNKIELFIKKINILYSFKINIKTNNLIFTYINLFENLKNFIYESIEQFLINSNQLFSSQFNPFLNYIDLKFFYNKVNSTEYYDFYINQNNDSINYSNSLLYKNKNSYLNNNFSFDFESYLESNKIISLLNKTNLLSFSNEPYLSKIKSILSFVYEEINSSFKDSFNVTFHFENKLFDYKNNHIHFLNCFFNENKLNKFYDSLKTYGNNIQFLYLKHFLIKLIFDYNLSFKNIKKVSSNENSKNPVMYNTKNEFIFILNNATFIIKKESSNFISFLKNLFYIYEKINLSDNKNLIYKKWFYDVLINHFQEQIIFSFTNSSYFDLVYFLLEQENENLLKNYNKQNHFLINHGINFFSFASCELLPNITFMKEINSTIYENHGVVSLGKIDPYLYYSNFNFRKQSSNFEQMDIKKVFYDKYNQIEFIFLNQDNFNLFKEIANENITKIKFFNFMDTFFNEIFLDFNYLK